MYVEKQTQYSAGIAEKVESASSEGKSKAAFRAINQLTGRKSRAPCGVETDSPADRVKFLQKHFQNLLSTAPPTGEKEVNQIFTQLPIESVYP